MRRDKRKPVPASDWRQVELFRVKLEIFAKLLEQGKTRREAMQIVWGEDKERGR